MTFRATTWVAALAFAVVGFATTCVLWPREGWRLHRDTRQLLANYIEHERPLDIDDMHHALADHLGDDYRCNAEKLERLYWGLSVACGALVVEILAFLWDLRGRRYPLA